MVCVLSSCVRLCVCVCVSPGCGRANTNVKCKCARLTLIQRNSCQRFVLYRFRSGALVLYTRWPLHTKKLHKINGVTRPSDFVVRVCSIRTKYKCDAHRLVRRHVVTLEIYDIIACWRISDYVFCCCRCRCCAACWEHRVYCIAWIQMQKRLFIWGKEVT